MEQAQKRLREPKEVIEVYLNFNDSFSLKSLF